MSRLHQAVRRTPRLPPRHRSGWVAFGPASSGLQSEAV